MEPEGLSLCSQESATGHYPYAERRITMPPIKSFLCYYI
jgi:hypothetical protein